MGQKATHNFDDEVIPHIFLYHSQSVADPVTSLSLSHDGKCLLASCMPMSGAVLKLIEKPTGDLLNAYKGHQNSAFPLGNAFTKTDSHVVSGAEDGSIVFWDLVEVSNYRLFP